MSSDKLPNDLSCAVDGQKEKTPAPNLLVRRGPSPALPGELSGVRDGTEKPPEFPRPEAFAAPCARNLRGTDRHAALITRRARARAAPGSWEILRGKYRAHARKTTVRRTSPPRPWL